MRNKIPEGLRKRAFTLIELIIVIAIIGIMSALIVAVVANATQDTRMVLARQQQAVVQESLNAWVAGYTMTNSIAAAQTAYSAQTTALAKFNNLLSSYLDVSTVSHFTSYTTNSAKLQSEALIAQGQGLTFSAWTNGTTPNVLMGP